MVKDTHLSVFDHFVGLALKELTCEIHKRVVTSMRVILRIFHPIHALQLIKTILFYKEVNMAKIIIFLDIQEVGAQL